MPAWVASLDKKVGRSNWDLCVKHALLGTGNTTAGGVREGDDVFVWLAPRGLIAWTRALESARPPSDTAQLPWPEPEKYKLVWSIEVVDDRVDDPVSTRWAPLQKAAEIRSSLQFFPRVPPDGVSVFTQHFVDLQRVSPLEAAMMSTLPTHDQRVYRSAVRPLRQGQQAFRAMVDAAYDHRCAITGTTDRAALEAAHIARYLGVASNQTRNGLLLRSDLHALFDEYLLTVLPDGTVHVAPAVTSPEYRALHGRSITMPAAATDKPGQELLAAHNKLFREGLGT